MSSKPAAPARVMGDGEMGLSASNPGKADRQLELFIFFSLPALADGHVEGQEGEIFGFGSWCELCLE